MFPSLSVYQNGYRHFGCTVVAMAEPVWNGRSDNRKEQGASAEDTILSNDRHFSFMLILWGQLPFWINAHPSSSSKHSAKCFRQSPILNSCWLSGTSRQSGISHTGTSLGLMYRLVVPRARLYDDGSVMVSPLGLACWFCGQMRYIQTPKSLRSELV